MKVSMAALDSESEPEINLDERDLEKLESDMNLMAKKIAEYRQTLPDHLKNTLDSALSSRRPLLPDIHSRPDPLPPSFLPIAETQVDVVLGTEEQDSGEKLMIELMERISRNNENIPKVVKRVRECVERIDKLGSLKRTIHPAFKRRRV